MWLSPDHHVAVIRPTSVLGVQSEEHGRLGLSLQSSAGQLHVQPPLEVVVVREIHGHVGEGGANLPAVLLIQLVGGREGGREGIVCMKRECGRGRGGDGEGGGREGGREGEREGGKERGREVVERGGGGGRERGRGRERGGKGREREREKRFVPSPPTAPCSVPLRNPVP